MYLAITTMQQAPPLQLGQYSHNKIMWSNTIAWEKYNAANNKKGHLLFQLHYSKCYHYCYDALDSHQNKGGGAPSPIPIC